MKQMLIWVISRLKPFALKVSAVDRHGGGYRLEVCSDVLGIVRRKNAKGRLFEDRDNVLKQESPDGDPFVDEETGETLLERRDRELERARRKYDTSLLDRGVGGEDEGEREASATNLHVQVHVQGCKTGLNAMKESAARTRRWNSGLSGSPGATDVVALGIHGAAPCRHARTLPRPPARTDPPLMQ